MTKRGSVQAWIREVALAHDQDECLIWPFGTDREGYGRVRIDGARKRAHRLVLQSAVGPPPESDAQTAHSCDLPSCVNPRHLRWASLAENMQDMVDRDRSAKGRRNPNAKLTEAKVLEMRKARADGDSYPAIASRYGVTKSTARSAVTGHTWAFVPEGSDQDGG